MTSNTIFVKKLNVGFIQTNLDGQLAWYNPSKKSYDLPMSRSAEILMWEQIKKGFKDVVNYYCKPNIIVLPELTLPLGYQKMFQKLCLASGAVVIAGLDFVKTSSGVENKALVVVPNSWPSGRKSKSVKLYNFGKTHFSQDEKDFFGKLGEVERPDPAMYIFHAEKYGSIGVAICSDFFDLERFVIYRGYIQHLIVIAHNKDTESYYFLAEAISRLVYCNVIICNTGFYGDSIAFSPYNKPYERYVYRHKGQGLFATQVVELPVEDLIVEQKKTGTKSKFKSPPPGYDYKG